MGPRHPNTLAANSLLGQVYVENGKTAQGVSLLEKTLEDSLIVSGPAATETLKIEIGLGWAYEAQGDLRRAERTWQRALEGFRRLENGQEGNTANAGELLGQNLTEQGKIRTGARQYRTGTIYSKE